MKIDVLVIAPNNSFSEAKCVEAAKEKGIPVISYDRLVEDSDVDLYISFDNEYTGKLMGKHVIEKVPEGNYLILNGSESDSNSEMLRTGYKSVLDTATKAGKIKIVAETYIEGWIREDAFAYVSEQLEIAQNRNIKIDAIICANDSLARGAIDALSEAGMAEGVVVVGQDADLIACQNLVNGKQSMTIYKPISSLVAKTVESSLLLAKGETISTKETYENGSYEIPYIKLQPIEVTKENLEETIIKDGFHLKKDIYGTTEQE